MMTLILKKHLGKKKGFTLIEVVVVLVILAILAAIAIPALIGYIGDAQERAAITQARTVLVGLQHLASTNTADGGNYFVATGLPAVGTNLSPAGLTQVNTLTGETYVIGTGSNGISAINLDATGKITGFVFRSQSGYVVTYTNGTFTAVKA